MQTLKDFHRWERVQAKADDFKYELEKHLRFVWEEYHSQGMHNSGDRFPDRVDTLSISSGRVYISGVSYCRGCTDREDCHIPVEFAFGTDEERAAMIAKHRAEKEAILQKKIQDEEEIQRKQYELLKAKFG